MLSSLFFDLQEWLPHHSKEWFILVSGFLAAVVNSVAGGGTMITFPALLSVGLPSMIANTTSSVAIFTGMPAGVWSYRTYYTALRSWIIALAPVSIIGGAIGGYLLIQLGNSWFESLVPWFVILATLLFLFQRKIQYYFKKNNQDQSYKEPDAPSYWMILVHFFLAIYVGYFGAAFGIMVLAILSIQGMRDIYKMNALKVILGLLCNIGNVIYFCFYGSVHWKFAFYIFLGALPGYWIGGRFAQNIPAVLARSLVIIVGVVIAGYYWIK